MTRELWYGLLGVAGLLVVLGLWLLGRDIRRAARTGPKWKRTLVAAALTMLAAVGIGGGVPGCTCYMAPPPPVTSETFLTQADNLEKQIVLLEQVLAQEKISDEVADQTIETAWAKYREVKFLMENTYASLEDRERVTAQLDRAEKLIRDLQERRWGTGE